MQWFQGAGRRRCVIAGTMLCFGLLLTGCKSSSRTASHIGTFRMGEKVQVGPLIYTTLEADWRDSLGEGGRSPSNRFLFLRVSITNSGGGAVSVPGLTLKGTGEKEYIEVTEAMENVQNWLGLLRTVQPSQTEQGYVVFDAPLAAYKLVVSDGGEVGSERTAQIDIPVQLE